MKVLTRLFTQLMNKYLPEPFVFVIWLTLITIFLAVIVEGQTFLDVTISWGDGFWDLLDFTTQVAVMLAMGYVLASAPLVNRLLDKLVSFVHKPHTAIWVATLVGGFGSYLNWAFGLIIGGIVAKKLAIKVKGVHYPLIIAAAYSGFTLYGLGLSSTVPLLISTPGHMLEEEMGLIPLSETIFSLPMLLTALVVIIALPLLNLLLHPKNKEEIIEYDKNLDIVVEEKVKEQSINEPVTIAYRLNNSRLTSLAIGLLGFIYIIYHFTSGGSLNFNTINFIFLFGGIILLGTPTNYVKQLNEGIKTVAGIILQYPFYAGIMAIMAASGLVNTISSIFMEYANVETLPLLGLLSSWLINFLRHLVVDIGLYKGHS